MTSVEARFQPRQAVRFIFEYEGDQVRLVAQQAVEMVVIETSAASVGAPGYYLDARDADDQHARAGRSAGGIQPQRRGLPRASRGTHRPD